MTPTTLAETILRDVRRYTIRPYVDDLPCLLEKDVLAALTAALDGVDERAVALTKVGYGYDLTDDDKAAITALLAQNAALRAERDNLSDKLELERALTDGAHRRARAAEAVAEKLRGAGSKLVAQLYQMWTEARDHRDISALGSAEYALRESIASALRDAYRAALTTEADNG